MKNTVMADVIGWFIMMGTFVAIALEVNYGMVSQGEENRALLAEVKKIEQVVVKIDANVSSQLQSTKNTVKAVGTEVIHNTKSIEAFKKPAPNSSSQQWRAYREKLREWEKDRKSHE